MVIYVDSSALTKLVIEEAESAAVGSYLTDLEMVSSSLLTVEVHRAVLRRDASRLPQLGLVLGRVAEINVSGAVIEAASRLPDPYLRSLDAIHLATALLLRGDIESVLTYDERLAKAAGEHGLAVSSPGATPASP